MDLPDCPPGAEGYEDSVVEMHHTKKPEEHMDPSCTKAEQEFQNHLASLKIRLENGETRPMVERRGRDISGKWIYLCYPCAAVCSGELILQGHISGRKHKTKLGMRATWPVSIFDDHPFNQCQKTGEKEKPNADLLKKMKEEVALHNTPVVMYDELFAQYRNVTCHIQYSIDAIKAPMIGVEYLVEHPPEEEHQEPSYICTLCTKQGHPRTIINHMTCFWHRYNYLNRHFPTATNKLKPLMSQCRHRDGIGITLNKLAQRVEDKYGRLRPINIDKEIYEKEKEKLMQWIYKGRHLSELDGVTFEEVVDPDLIESLYTPNVPTVAAAGFKNKKDPSPPRVPAPKAGKPQNNRSYRNERRLSMDLSDISDEDRKDHKDDYRKKRNEPAHKPRWEPYNLKRGQPDAAKPRFTNKNPPKNTDEKQPRPPNYEYKLMLTHDKRTAAEDAAKKMLAYHEKNPEKHPLYPEEWKKFWNRRYKEIQAEGKDPSKHDFKPEWIVYWTKRMKELHDEELRVAILELYRKMNISPPDMNKRESPPSERRRSAERRRSPDCKRLPDRRQHDYRRSPERRRSPVRPQFRDTRRDQDRRRSPERRRSVERRRSQDRPHIPDYRVERNRSPSFRPIVDTRKSPARHRSPILHKTRSRSPLSRRSPARTNIVLDSMEHVQRSRSPLSRRGAELPHRNRSPAPRAGAARNPPPSMQTVLVSDDEFKAEDSGLSPWNSDNDIDSVCSVVEVRSVAGSAVSRGSKRYDRGTTRAADSHDLGPVENVIATLRTLVALEDYLGSIGPKIVDLLTEGLRMEKEKANSSEELLVRDSAVVLIETAKEKLKGAAQAGLVAPAAAPAVRAAVVRAAATLHEADTRIKRAQDEAKKKASMLKQAEPVPVAGVGVVDRAQIAQQMAAALIAQGKTDVTSEELSQLVDAVVGMAEAKKREAESKAREARQPVKPKEKKCGTATALQMLQSAYDENDKKETAKEEVPDAMDGLSDSDLETLLKAFNELSAEEQHSLIAYLKKLEAREPQRVERLRQYVSAAASSSASSNPNCNSTPASAPPPEPSSEQPPPVQIESDDDDYTVEEVMESAQQKVKENQMRKEIEVVKNTLKEMKEKEATPPKSPAVFADLTKKLTAASDILALVQASIQSKAPSSAPAAISRQTTNVVVNSTQSRSFGDLPSSIQSLINPQQSKAFASGLQPIQDEPKQQSPIDNYQADQPISINKLNDATYNKNDVQSPYNENDNQHQYNQNDNDNQHQYNQNDNDNQHQYNQNDNQSLQYNQNDIQSQYNQNDDYNQGGNYNQGNNYKQVDSFNNQPLQNDYNQSQSYNQNEPYNQSGSYNQNQPFNQNSNFNHQNQHQSFENPWTNARQIVPVNRVPMNQGFNNFNQGPGQNQFQPRGNFPNGRQDNNNYMGRGRGNFVGSRGRARGRY